MNGSSSPRNADYPRIPDHSDLRGFSYRAPERFDYRDERKAAAPFWRRLLAKLGWKEGA